MAIRADEIDEMPGGVDIDRDRRLVLRHQQGDVLAFDELYRRYHSRLVSFCVRRVGDRHAAEELAQEAFVKALRAMPNFAGERRFYPWMTVIAGRLCIDHHRRNARVEPSPEIDLGSVDADHDDLFASVDRRHLTDALDRLAPRHREILELREQRGWSYQQIATHLDVPLTTVEALLHRARKALRREFLSVAGDERGRRFAVSALAGGLVAKLKGWIAVAGPERLAPALGAVAAGTLTVGLVAGPLTDEAGGEPTPTTPTVAVVPAATVLEPAAATEPVVVTAAAAPASTATTLAAPPAHTDPPPSVDLGVATWYPGPEGDAYVDERIECMPIRIDLRPLANLGVDVPLDIVDDLLPPSSVPERCP